MRLKDEKTKRKNGEGGRADAVVDGGLLRRSLQLRRRAKKRESREGLVRGRRVNGGRRRKMKKKMRGEVGGFVRREGKGMFGLVK